MMQARRALFLGIETISRELDSCILLAHAAMQRDWDVVLASRSQALWSALATKHGVLIQTSGERGQRYPQRPEDYPELRYIQFHQEGLAPRNDEELLSRYPPELDFAHRVMLFGERQADVLREHRQHYADRLTVVGSPRFDLLRPEYRAAIGARRTHDAIGDQPYVLINTSFKAGNISSVDPNFELMYAQNAGPWGMEVLSRRRQLQTRLVAAYVDLIRDLRATDPALRVVLRPHPSEDHDTWRRLLAGIAGVEVVYRLSAAEWIDRSTVMIHTGCTTGVEGRFLGRNVLRFNPFADESDEPPLPNAVSVAVGAAADVVDHARRDDASERRELSAEEVAILTPWLANTQGALAVNRILDEIERLEVTAPRQPLLPTLARSMTASPRQAAGRVFRAGHRARRALGGAMRHITEQKFPDLTVDDVVPMLRAFEALDGVRPANVRRVGHHTIGLTRRP